MRIGTDENGRYWRNLGILDRQIRGKLKEQGVIFKYITLQQVENALGQCVASKKLIKRAKLLFSL